MSIFAWATGMPDTTRFAVDRPPEPALKQRRGPVERRLEDDTVALVKRDLVSMRQCEVMAKYNLAKYVVSRIKHGKTYQDVEAAK